MTVVEEDGVDPVLIGAGAAVLTSVVSGVVQVIRQRMSTEVQLARISQYALTERVRCITAGGTMEELGGGHHLKVTRPAGWSGGGGHGGGDGKS